MGLLLLLLLLLLLYQQNADLLVECCTVFDQCHLHLHVHQLFGGGETRRALVIALEHSFHVFEFCSDSIYALPAIADESFDRGH